MCQDWVPISKKTTNIYFKDKCLKCKRLQFPVIEACALTIHKSQGGTYPEIVYDYDIINNYDIIIDYQQLVYVALSRVTSLEGLHITNKDNDHNF